MPTDSRTADGHASVVCLHGLDRTPSDWDGVRAGLEPFGLVRTPHLPGRPADALARADSAIRAGDIVVAHSLGGVVALRLARDKPRPLRALVLTGCFFPPARNGRSLTRTAGDYAAHRVAFVRSIDLRRRDRADRPGGSVGALASLIRLAARPGDFGATLAAVAAPVLVVHAEDDHHVPVAFALAAAARQPGWSIEILDHGGHNAHVDRPQAWLDAVTPWLQEIGDPRRATAVGG